ncbi:MAG: hypothetical protein AAB305_03985 [Candidatus Zixiibacteriota bacterium]
MAQSVQSVMVEMTSFDQKNGGLSMTPSKQKRAPMGMPRKNYWHLYSLQTLDSEKLARIVNKILRREFHLVK